MVIAVGEEFTIKLVELVTMPPGNVIVIGPEVALEGRVVVICVPLFVLIVAETPLMAIAVAPAKDPGAVVLIVMVSPEP